MRKKIDPLAIPPRVGFYTHDFRDGRGKIRIKIIRDSKLCKWLRIPVLTFWNRIYLRDTVITRKRLLMELSIIRIQRHCGFWPSLWTLIKRK
jgi:hypothetical protein